MADNEEIRSHIAELVVEERMLRDKRSRSEISADDEHARLRAIEVELDQAWDLLRQRDARKEFGHDPDSAAVRSADVVERYEG